MGQTDRKTLVRQCKETPPPAGIFRIRNTKTGRALVGATRNLPGMLNRQRFQLEHGSHPHRELQSDWNNLGPRAFELETLDILMVRTEPQFDLANELQVLLDLWLEKLAATREPLYESNGQEHLTP